MLSRDEAGRVIHASSFSKTVSPGVRVGYLAGPAEEIAKISKRGSENYISPNMLAESIVLEMCRSGILGENVEFVNKALRERRDALVTALNEHIPEAEFVVPEGGYFLWLDLTEGRTAPRCSSRQGRGRRLRRRPRLHARGRRQQPAALLRQRAGRSGRRGRAAAGAGARLGSRTRAGRSPAGPAPNTPGRSSRAPPAPGRLRRWPAAAAVPAEVADHEVARGHGLPLQAAHALAPVATRLRVLAGAVEDRTRTWGRGSWRSPADLAQPAVEGTSGWRRK